MAAPVAPAVIDAVIAGVVAGKSYRQIAPELGLTHNAVSGIVYRLRQAGDPRVPPAGQSPAMTKERARDALADAWANGAVNLQVAARRAGLTITQAKDRWREIVDGLGWQAR